MAFSDTRSLFDGDDSRRKDPALKGRGLASDPSNDSRRVEDDFYLAHLSVFSGWGSGIESRMCRSFVRFGFPSFELKGLAVESGVGEETVSLDLLIRHQNLRHLTRKISLGALFDKFDSYQRVQTFVDEFNAERYFGGAPRAALRYLVDSSGEVDWYQGLPSLLLATPHRTEKHREPLRVESFFAPSLVEFSEGINRHSIILRRDNELVAEFVCVDDGKKVRSSYAYVVGVKGPVALPLAQETPVEFQNHVLEIVSPVLRSRFASLGLVVPRIISDLEKCRSGGNSSHAVNQRNGHANRASWDLFRLAESRAEWSNSIAGDVLRLSRILESSPITESYTPAEFPLVVSPLIGGLVQLFADTVNAVVLVRFSRDSGRNPAVYGELALRRSLLSACRALEPLESITEAREVSDTLYSLVEEAEGNVKLFGSHVGESYPKPIRDLVSELNGARIGNGDAQEHQQNAIRFGFVGDIIPSLAPNFSYATSEVLRGRYPLHAVIPDRDLWLPAACQMMIAREFTGTLRFYSRLGSELHIELPERGVSMEQRRDLLLQALSLFVTKPEILASSTWLKEEQFPRRVVGGIGFAPSKQATQIASIAHAFWELDPISGFQGDHSFPSIPARAVRQRSSKDTCIVFCRNPENRGRSVVAKFSEHGLVALGVLLDEGSGGVGAVGDEFSRCGETRVLWLSRQVANKGEERTQQGQLGVGEFVTFYQAISGSIEPSISAFNLRRELTKLFPSTQYSRKIELWGGMFAEDLPLPWWRRFTSFFT